MKKKKAMSFAMTALIGLAIAGLVALLVLGGMGKINLPRIFKNIFPNLYPPEGGYVESYVGPNGERIDVKALVNDHDSCWGHDCSDVVFMEKGKSLKEQPPTGFLLDYDKNPISVEIKLGVFSYDVIGQIQNNGDKKVLVFDSDFISSCSTEHKKEIQNCERVLALNGAEFVDNNRKMDHFRFVIPPAPKVEAAPAPAEEVTPVTEGETPSAAEGAE